MKGPMRYLFLLLALLLGTGTVQAFTTDGQEDICATAAVVFCDNFETRAEGNTDLAATRAVRIP